MRVTEDALDRIGSRAVGGQPEQLEARMSGEPSLDRLGMVDAVVVRYEVVRTQVQ